MEQVGVQAVVQGLASFMSDMRQVNSAIDGLRPTGTLLQRTFESVGDAILGFGAHILRVAEVTIGVLLRDAINFIIGKLGELINSIIEAGAEFQILQLRLERLNLNTLLESGMEFNQAMEESIRLTKEQLEWIQRLSASSPYDAQDVANIFTLARSYGATSEEAERLTENVLDFASGMGLGNTEMERIIINFGQLMQQGKLNGQELRDLARGAFVPVNDILKKMAANMGITVDELNKMRDSGEDGQRLVTEFMTAFNELVEERFVGASEKMSRTVKGAVDNFKDLFKSILGFGVVTPILDVIGGKIADIVEAFTGTETTWNRLVSAAQNLGSVLASLIGDIIDVFLPSADTIADSVVNGLTGIANWVVEHRQEIIDFFINVRDVIKNEIIPWITDKFIPALMRIVNWVFENKDKILEFFQSLGNIIGTVFSKIFGSTFEGGDVVGSVLGGIENFMDFVIKNQDKIAEFIVILGKLILAWEILSTAFNIAIGIITTVGGALLTAFTVIVSLVGIVGFLGATVSAVVAAIIVVFLTFVAELAAVATFVALRFQDIMLGAGRLRDGFINVFDAIKNRAIDIFYNVWGAVNNLIGDIVDTVRNGVGSISTAFFDVDWWGIGTNIIYSVANGISSATGFLAQTAAEAAYAAYSEVLAWLGIGSPSKLFMEVGEMSMLGMAEGIKQYASLARMAMADAVGQVAAPAMILPATTLAIAGAAASGNTYNSEQNNNYNLNIQSNADREPIFQDFGLLQSLQGG